MRKPISMFFLCVALLAAPAFADDQKSKEDDLKRIENAGTVLQEILAIPENIPQNLLDKADCVAVLPSVVKGAFLVGGQYGRGVMVCRTGKNFSGPWGAPAMYLLEGASVGFQLGGEATDFVLMVMNPRGMDSLLNSKVKLGADASVAAGPKGREADAETDAYLRAEILAYSRSRGLFGGVSLEGSTLRPDEDANKRVYGRVITAREIIMDHEVSVPPAGRALLSRLQTASPHIRSEQSSVQH
jgi:lipid-binding SYLF domain-containing protein